MMEKQMRRSRVLEKLRRGELVSSFKVNLDSARVSELAAMAGFDCIWTDLEHTPNDWSLIERQIWAAKAHDADVLVRVTRGSYSDHMRALELDAAGVIVPHIRNLQDARDVVRMMRFQPIGRRGLDGGNADGGYCRVPLADYLRDSNSERLLILQIEDPEPLDDIEAIAALEGVDMLFFGPADFSHGIGAPGDFSHPLLVETRRRIGEACRANGKWAATTGSPDNFEELARMGYRFINMCADVLALNAYCRQMLQYYTPNGNIRGENSAEPVANYYHRAERPVER